MALAAAVALVGVVVVGTALDRFLRDERQVGPAITSPVPTPTLATVVGTYAKRRAQARLVN